MPPAVRADRKAMRLTLAGAAQEQVANQIVDVFFDEHRVWSIKLPDAHLRSGVCTVHWPAAMLPYLTGSTELAVRSSATGADIATAEVNFGGAGRVSITDAQGRWLAMNKWNRFGPSFEGDESGIQDRLLASSAEVAGQMQLWGYPVYIVGGTLLGAMRSGTLLPHDDDTDFAFWCDKTSPEDVALVTFELQRQLEAAGHTVVRHSHAHLELVFFTDEGATDYYIDVFAGYHDAPPDGADPEGAGGLYNQPFALRGELSREDLVPTKTIEVGGITLPAPAAPEAWLEYAYGPDWRVPDPSFRWDTPRETLRRFENSFGVFNRQRVFWEKTWQEFDRRADFETFDAAEASALFDDADRFLTLLPEHAFVVDLGCGDGRHAERIAAAGHQVLGIDYSFEALRVARLTQPAGVEYRFLNLNDRHELLGFALELIEQGRQPYFFARNLLHEMRALGRTDLLVTLRGVLDAQTFLYATFDCTPAARRIVGNPETWNLPRRTLKREAWRWKLGTSVLSNRTRPTPYGPRTNATALVWL